MPMWPVRMPPTAEAALRDLSSADPAARTEAIVALASCPPDLAEEAQRRLIKALDDGNPKVRAEAALALAELGPQGAVERLIELSSDGSARVRQAAIIALGESEAQEALPTLIGALDSENADVRFQTVIAVARLAPEEAFEPLKERVDDPDPEVRANVAAAFADMGQEQAIPLLEDLLCDGEAQVRYEAALALAALGQSQGAAVLIDALADHDAAPQAVRALALLREPSALDPIRSLAKRWLIPPTLKAQATAAWTALDSEGGWPELEPWLSARRREPRAMAIYACGEYQLPVAVPLLVSISNDPNNPDRDAAVRALGQIGDPRAKRVLSRLSDASDPELAADAREALERIGQASQ